MQPETIAECIRGARAEYAGSPVVLNALENLAIEIGYAGFDSCDFDDFTEVDRFIRACGVTGKLRP
jgi:hypothetical protein